MENQGLPPLKRTADWSRLNEEAAGQGRFILPVCKTCAAVQYPPREICRDCLGLDIAWEELPAGAIVLGLTQLNASTSAFFREHLPVHVGLLRLDCGPLMYVHMADPGVAQGDRVQVRLMRDIGGQAIFVALSETSGEAEQLARLEEYLLEKQD